ncbi:MAG: sulfite exporter TauE/SafE family protein [Nitrosomonas sp.]|nr:sulfite exporter TauE/SafE family protein [Nitrosomonas sp.]MDP1949527.1 sulfite exporter TauE/SafE family protein [Nitrosomonas sp.]
MEWWLVYLLLGAIVGFFAGLLGIGGGLVIVPVLTFIFTAQDFPPDRILHLALGTTMATIIFTSASSLRTHHAHGAVNWEVVKTITPGIIIGTLGGATLAGTLTSQLLSLLFVIFIFYAATQMLLKLSPKPSRQLPGKMGMFAAGGVIGTLSSLVAIGGGLLSIPFLTLCNVKLHHAIGTAAAIGFPIAVAGTVGYIINGVMQAEPLPDYSLGYVYLPALGWLVLASMLTAPPGARMTHATQTATLRKIFVALLYCLAFKMLYGLF